MADWGFLGAGSIAASSLAPAVHAADRPRLHAVAATDARRARALDPARVYTRYEDLLDDPAVDIVYISLHNSAHRPWVERALRAGKHVLCEKPLGLTAAEVAAMAATARATGRLLVEAAWNRWHPRTRDLESMITRGAIGTVRTVTARFDGLAPAPGNYRLDAALGGGALYDVGYYAVSAALAAFGWRTPRVVSAEQDLWRPGSADAATRFRLEFPGQGTAEVGCSLVGDTAETFTTTGTGGSITLAPPAFCAGVAPSTLTATGEGRRHYPPQNPYRLMVEAVDSAAEGDTSAHLVPLAESLRIAATLDAVRDRLVPGGV
ncbi:Gfo/Idh/MocA family protein [Streptomyces sp. NRRL S-350]|uniref:Gfo/Idh/MocA family protein n=1 Tax=Streptomyces sp. NRRL S-350 TaxID=1463902 RepID=UPI00068E9E2E|nr:Gfo/Idh/MocA family oxidoreductase [Streptomyces sp. NRRL S-350]